MQVMNLTLSGGEPLANRHFFEIGQLARELGFVTRIKSNGHALNEDIARRLRAEVDPFTIELSLHGATAETHDRQTRVARQFRKTAAKHRVHGRCRTAGQTQLHTDPMERGRGRGSFALADTTRREILDQFDSDASRRWRYGAPRDRRDR